MPKRGFDFGHLVVQVEQKERTYLKKVKALLQVKINCIKVVFKSQICIIQL